MDCILLAKVDWRSGKEGDIEYVAADDNGVFSPRRDGSLYVIGTRWLAEGALTVTGTREFPDGTHKRLRVSMSVIKLIIKVVCILIISSSPFGSLVPRHSCFQHCT